MKKFFDKCKTPKQMAKEIRKVSKKYKYNEEMLSLALAEAYDRGLGFIKEYKKKGIEVEPIPKVMN